MKNLIKKSYAIQPEALPSGWIYQRLSANGESGGGLSLKGINMPNPTATPRASSKSPFGGFRGLFLLFCLFFSQKTHAQMAGTPYPTPYGCTNVATEGQEFWLTFGSNYGQSPTNIYLALQLVNGNGVAATATLTFTATGQSANITIPANTSLEIDLSNVPVLGDMRSRVYQAAGGGTGSVSVTNSNSLQITSNLFISVFAFNTYVRVTDATIVLPTRIWGVEYYNVSYRAYSTSTDYDVHMIIANQPNTNIYINGSSTPAATLNTGQVWYAPATSDLTGTHITTDKPVAYFIHNTYADMPTTIGGQDVLFQQLMPVGQWGQYFLIPNQTQFSTNAAGANFVRIMASQNNTLVNFTNAVSVNGNDGYTLPSSYQSPGNAGTAVSSITLNAGQWTQVQISGGQNSYCIVSADKPVGVVDFMTGGDRSNGMGDPSACRITAVTNLIVTGIASPFVPPSTFPRGGSSNLGIVGFGITPRHYMLILAPTASKNAVTISRNGVSLGTLTAAAGASSQNVTDPNNTGTNNTISAATTWVDVPTPINGTLYSYIRYDFNYLTDAGASYRITNPNSGILITQVGIGYYESYSVNSGSGGCLVR